MSICSLSSTYYLVFRDRPLARLPSTAGRAKVLVSTLMASSRQEEFSDFFLRRFLLFPVEEAQFLPKPFLLVNVFFQGSAED